MASEDEWKTSNPVVSLDLPRSGVTVVGSGIDNDQIPARQRAPLPPMSPSDSAALTRKVDLHVLPGVGMLYLLSILDRSSVENARIEGLEADLGMSGNGYLTGLTLFFVGYVLFEMPCNIALKRTSPRFWLPTLGVCWGIVATMLGVVSDPTGFLAGRFVLGVAQSGLFPGVVYYFSMWYTRRQRVLRISLLFSAAALAGSLGGMLAYVIGFMKGIVWENGWHWIFVLEGIITMLMAVCAYGFIHDYPSTASFLGTSERRHLRARLAAESDATRDEVFSWAGVHQALVDPKCWLYGLCFHTTSLPLYTFSLFLPTIIAQLGYTAARAQLLTVPPYAFAFLTTLCLALMAERRRRRNLRALFACVSSLVACLGYVVLLSNPDPKGRPALSFTAIFLVAGGVFPATALALAWPALNVSGQTKRAVAIALQISVGSLGAVLGTQLYRQEGAPRYRLGNAFALAYLVVNIVVSASLWCFLRRENKRRDQVALEIGSGGSGQMLGDVRDWKGDEDVRWRFRC